MGFLKKLFGPEKPASEGGAGTLGGKVVVIDNTSPSDNWIVNKSGAPVSVACNEMFGSFAVHLGPGESRRVTSDVTANAYPAGQYSYDDLKYNLGKGETWEVRRNQGALVMIKVKG
jgi:hypothetical protein